MFKLINIYEFKEGNELRLNCLFKDGDIELNVPLIFPSDVSDIEKQRRINKLVEDINIPEDIEEEE